MMSRFIGALASFAVAAFVAVAPAQAEQLRYHVRLLSPAASGAAYAVNQKGVAAGVDDYDHGASFNRDGSVTNLGTLGGGLAMAYGINAYGQAAGYSSTAAGETHAFRWGQGVMTDLGTLSTSPTARSEAYGINKSGHVVGTTTVMPSGQHAFLWSGHAMKDLGVLPGASSSDAQAINAAGHIVGNSSGTGTNAFIYRDGQMSALAPAAGQSWAYAINDTDQAVGSSYFGTSSGHWMLQACLYDQGTVKSLGTARASDTGSEARGINNQGVAVGASWASFLDRVAFVYDGTTTADLNTLVKNGADWVLTDARAVNDKGQIAGYGLYQGEVHAFLATPIAP